MVDLNAIWRQCMECAGLAIFGFSLLMAAFCGLAALLAAIEGKEKTEADKGQSRHDAQAHGRGSDRRALSLV